MTHDSRLGRGYMVFAWFAAEGTTGERFGTTIECVRLRGTDSALPAHEPKCYEDVQKVGGWRFRLPYRRPCWRRLVG